LEIRLVGAHNLSSNTTKQSSYLIDRVMAVDVGGLASGLSPEEQGEIAAVLLTHRHFDHTRDIPTLALMTLDDPKQIDVYSLPETLEAVRTHLIDGDVYPDFTKKLTDAPPKYRFQPIEAGVVFKVLDYEVKPIPVPHPVPAVGFIVRSSNGGGWAYTGDTGGELLRFFQDDMAPDVIFVDVTFPSRLEFLAKLTGHMTPSLLREQLIEAMEANVKIPRMLAVHMNVPNRAEVTQEVNDLATELGVDLGPGVEEMRVVV
jgi:phosphoribosyl 1,2-cyclic phosphodiesterase